MRIAIVGAGIAGLAAGYRLKKANLEPVIFESASFAGGRMSSLTVDGFVLDKGAYTIPESHIFFLELLHELGLSNQLVETPGTSSTFLKGVEHRMKIGSPTDFLKYKLIGMKDKKNLMKLFIYARALGKSLNLSEPTEKTLQLEKETVSDYLLREYSPELLEQIAYPMFADLFLGSPEGNSKAAFLATLRNLTHFKIYTLSRGMGTLTEKLKTMLDVRLDTPVIRIGHGKEKGVFHVETGGNTPTSHAFDKIIFAVPATTIPKLFADFPPSLSNGLERVHYTPSIVVAVALSKPCPGNSMMNTFTRKEFQALATVVLDRYKGEARIPKGTGLATAILTQHMSERLLREPDSVVARTALTEMASLWPGLRENVLFTRVFRWSHAGVQLPPGTLKAQKAMRNELESRFRDLAVAGDGLHRASMEVSLRTGYRAADHILA